MWTVLYISNGTKYYSCTWATSSFNLPPNHCSHPSVLWHFSFTPDGKMDVIKDCVYISRILLWIMRLISIPNWFKWLFFFLTLEKPNRVSAGWQEQRKWQIAHCITISLGLWLLPGWVGLRRQQRAERKAKLNHLIFSLLTRTKDHWRFRWIVPTRDLFFSPPAALHRNLSLTSRAPLL